MVLEVPDDKIVLDADITVGAALGTGSFGAVHEATHRGQPCVLKVLALVVGGLQWLDCVYGS